MKTGEEVIKIVRRRKKKGERRKKKEERRNKKGERRKKKMGETRKDIVRDVKVEDTILKS